jgi:NADH:ubiquinone reductase (H+-translocating)
MPRERFFLELEPPTEALRGRPHVVIVGGGFAGLAACKALAGADLRVTLIDKRNYNLFQPLLYQVSTGLVAPGDVTVPLRLLLAMEEAEQTPEAGKRRLLQSVVVVGGGPTGCELAGSVSELLRHALARDFRQLEPGDTRILLVDPGDRLLRGMHPDLGAGARRFLESIGVEVLLGGRVKAIEPGRVTISTAAGEQVREAATVCWTAGVKASPLGARLAEATGVPLDRGGRVPVEADFCVPGHPEIRVVGDLCAYVPSPGASPLPGLASVAVQMGRWVARDLRAGLEGRSQAPFRFVDFGSMAMLGRLHAEADLRGWRVDGPLGWLIWGVAHLGFMPANENRVSLLIKWLWAIAARQRGSLLIMGEPCFEEAMALSPAPTDPGCSA